MDESHAVLHGENLEQAMQQLHVSWSVLPGKGLVRIIPTQSFREGFMFVARLADLAEHLHHDPEVILRRDEVEISLVSYETGGTTNEHVAFAEAVDRLLDETA